MEINSKRAKVLDAYLEKHKSAQIGNWNIEISGVKESMTFYRFPIKELLYNKHNWRISIEIKEWENQNKREIDKYNDRAIIGEILLKLDKEKTNDLEDDLRKKGQMEPGVITNDGFVINGNRRMAILEYRLDQKEPAGKWEYFEAMRLPAEISEEDLFKIEGNLQLSKDKVAPYHPVKDLIMIDHGIKIGLKPEAIAASIYGMTMDKVYESIDRLNLINMFLDFWGAPSNYGLIMEYGLHEYFINMQKNIVLPSKKQGIKHRELVQNIEYAFTLLRANILESKNSTRRGNTITHLDFRKLGSIFSDVRAKATFIENMVKAKKIKDTKAEIVIEDFNDAVEVLELNKQRFRPAKLIETAINALESIDQESEHFCKAQVEISFKKLLDIVNKMNEKLSAK